MVFSDKMRCSPLQVLVTRVDHEHAKRLAREALAKFQWV